MIWVGRWPEPVCLPMGTGASLWTVVKERGVRKSREPVPGVPMTVFYDNPGQSFLPLSAQSIGWRLRTLRLRRGITLVDLAQGSGLDVSYLSRLERDALQNAKPKPDTIKKVLNALGATPHEVEAVYHVERPQLAPDEIREQISALQSLEDDPHPCALRDEHWYAWYYNRAARAILAFTAEEYPKSVGVHLLHEMIDPSIPRFSRVPEHYRRRAFSERARMFKAAFAGEEFDSWYLNVLTRVYAFPWAVELWENPDTPAQPLLIDRQESLFTNPRLGEVKVSIQISRLVANPRFLLASWSPIDPAISERFDAIRNSPEFAYNVMELVPNPRIR